MPPCMPCCLPPCALPLPTCLPWCPNPLPDSANNHLHVYIYSHTLCSCLCLYTHPLWIQLPIAGLPVLGMEGGYPHVGGGGGGLEVPTVLLCMLPYLPSLPHVLPPLPHLPLVGCYFLPTCVGRLLLDWDCPHACLVFYTQDGDRDCLGLPDVCPHLPARPLLGLCMPALPIILYTVCLPLWTFTYLLLLLPLICRHYPSLPAMPRHVVWEEED